MDLTELDAKIATLSAEYLTEFFRHEYAKATAISRELDAARAERMAITRLPVAS